MAQRGGGLSSLRVPPECGGASGRTRVSPDATDGGGAFVRLLEAEQMRCNLFFSIRAFPAVKPVHHSAPSASFICLQLYDDEESSITFVASLFIPLWVSKPLYSFLSRITPFCYLTFLISSAPHPPLPPPWARVVINPCFIAGELSSPYRADSSPRSETPRGPNSILPPCITPSLPPSGPDYRGSGGGEVRGGGGFRGRHHNITPREREESGRKEWMEWMMHNMLV